MLKVLLVDDELFIAQGLSVLIDWEKEGFEIVSIASNGLEALEYLRENTVDLIIADIKMPIMTGLELLEAIRREQISEAMFVILSGYNDFAYAQRAMRNSCMEYMLKPVQKEELLKILHKVSDVSETNKVNQEEKQEMERAYLDRNLISLLVGKYDNINLEYVKNHMKLSEGIRYIDIEFAHLENSAEEEDGEMRQMQRKLHQTCQTIMAEDGDHLIFDVSRDENSYDTGLIYCDYMATNQECSEEEFLKQLHKGLEMGMQHPIKMLVGKKVTDISSISKSYGSSCVLKSFEAFRPKKEIYYYEKEVQVNQGGFVLCKNSLDDLLHAIEQNDQMDIRKKVDALYDEMTQMELTTETMDLNINYLLFQLIHLASEQDDEVNQGEILHFISDSSFEEGVMRGSRSHMTRFAGEYAEYLGQLRKNVSRGVFQEIEREVRENFAENLTLRDLSKKYYVNSSYLGQIFKKKYDMSFKDYLGQYRINEATKLLVKTDKKITQIAEEVGYKDSDYFIRKFIEMKGCTPSKYRKNYR